MEYPEGTRVYWKSGNIYGKTTGIVRDIAGIKLIEVRFENGSVKGLKESQLKIVEEEMLDFTSLFHQRNFFDFQHFRQYLTHIRIKGGLTNVVYSMKYGDVEFFPYQFKPVFKFIDANEQRLLIADEVGLGKTIESLYIWKELQAREDAIRLLVVCPAMLRSKWKKDMEVHFGISGQIVDSTELLELCQEAQAKRNKPFALITSLEGIRQKNIDENKLDNETKNRKAVRLNKFFEEVYEDPEFNELFDLVVFDEAAKLTNSETANFATSRRINNISKNLILLSATPVSNSQSDLYSLLRILSPSEYKNEFEFNSIYEQNRAVVNLAHCFYSPSHDLDKTIEQAEFWIEEVKKTPAFGKDPYFDKLEKDLFHHIALDDLRRKTYTQLTERYFYSNVFSRSRKRDVIENIAVRHAQTADFTLQGLELEVYESCTKDLQEMCLEEHDRIFSFGIMARQREMASSIPAAIRRWKETAVTHEFINEEDELSDDSQFNSYPSLPQSALDLTEEQLNTLEKEDRKYERFLKEIKLFISAGELDGRNEKIVVFSFFRQTLKYLLRRLTHDGINAIMIVGGMDQEEKDANLTQFRDDPSINVFLSSEVGAEGLDMQFSNLEFNYDLPWNPMRLEQRIGRIDRIGQQSKTINIVNMFCSNTIEDRVLSKLYEKIHIFKESIGELDEILGQQTQEIETKLISPLLTDEDKLKLADAEIDRFYVNLQSIRTLEESAGLSKAYSDTIIDYVNTAEKNSRYIRKEDLINYMYDYFTKDGQGSHFSKNEYYKDCWDLELSDRDRISMNDFLASTGKYFAGANKSKMICTFPQGKKATSNLFTNIDVNHPIIKWLVNCTEKVLQDSSLKNSFTLNVPKDSIDITKFNKSSYVFYLCNFECKGLKRKKELLYFVCSPEDLVSKTSTESENFVSQSLFNGTAVTDLNSKLSHLNNESIDKALECCKSEFIKTISAIKTELEDDNEALYYRMMAKTKSFYENKITRQCEIISEKEQFLKDLAGTISTIITNECGLNYETQDLIVKTNAIRKFLSLKTNKEKEIFSELSIEAKSRLVKLSSSTKELIETLQKQESVIKGLHTKLDNTNRQYKSSIEEVEQKKNMEISYDELCGGIIFVV